jgi:hypothetical protein
MISEVKVTGGGPYVAKAERTVPAAAGVWLTREQLDAAGLRPPPGSAAAKEQAAKERPAKKQAAMKQAANMKLETIPEHTEAATATAAATAQQEVIAESSKTGSDNAVAASAPRLDLGTSLPLGFGMIEDLPDFVPLLGKLRAAVGRKDTSTAEALFPKLQLADHNDNVLRLLRVLDRDGSAGLLSGAMDGGVPVELFHSRRTPYWAVFKVRRTGPGTVAGQADDSRDMEYITSAVTQKATSRDSTRALGVDGIVAGAGKPEAGLGPIRTVGGTGGLGAGISDSVKSASVGRGQLGMKTVAEASSAKSARMRVPIEATLELHSSKGRVALASLGRQHLVHRILENDLRALSRLQPVPVAEVAEVGEVAQGAPVAQASSRADDADASRLGPWRHDGVALPMEAQVNGFQGAPQIRRTISDTVKAARGSERYGRTGDAAAYTQREAVSTEWLIAALPLLTSAGVDLPVVHASGVEGQDLRTSLHARLRSGRVLGIGDKMTFETVAQSGLDAPRPTGGDNQQSVEHSKTARAVGGAGLVNTGFRMNQLLANADQVGGATDVVSNSSGSMPLHKPKSESVLVQFTLDVRVVARVTNRGRSQKFRVSSQKQNIGVRDITVPQPVVVRMPAPEVRRMLSDPANLTKLQDPDGHLAPATAPAQAPAERAGEAP